MKIKYTHNYVYYNIRCTLFVVRILYYLVNNINICIFVPHSSMDPSEPTYDHEHLDPHEQNIHEHNNSHGCYLMVMHNLMDPIVSSLQMTPIYVYG